MRTYTLVLFGLLLSARPICSAQVKTGSQPARESIKNSGFMMITDLGLLANNNTAGVTMSVIAGSQINEHQSIGLGIGYDTYDSATAIPIFVDLRTYLFPGDVKPILFADAGYAFLSRLGKSGNLGGLTVKAGAGLKVFIGTDFAFFLDAGFKYQMASTSTETFVYNDGYYEEIKSESSTPHDSFVFEIGLSF
jgi:hypothetical protein